MRNDPTHIAPPPEVQSPALPRRLLPMLMLGTFLVWMDFFVASPLLTSLARAFAVPVVAAVVPAFALPYGLGALLLAPLSERLGCRPLLLLSRVLAGIAAAALTPNLYALVSDLAPERDWPRFLGYLLSGIMSGLVVGVPLGTALAEAVGWRGVFWALGAFGLLLLAAFAVVARTGTPGGVSLRQTAGRALHAPGARPALLTSALLYSGAAAGGPRRADGLAAGLRPPAPDVSPSRREQRMNSRLPE